MTETLLAWHCSNGSFANGALRGKPIEIGHTYAIKSKPKLCEGMAMTEAPVLELDPRSGSRRELLRVLDADLAAPPSGEVWAVHHADWFTDEGAIQRKRDALIAWERSFAIGRPVASDG